MIIILSQRIDYESGYSGDEVFNVYHYPGRYRNQIHSGDTFVYYQGNRYDKSQRYYFGAGKVGEITTIDDDNFRAQLIDVIRFQTKVPIYLPDGGYVEQLGYNTVRKSINPPWQSSIRPLSTEAYQYILKHALEDNVIPEYESRLKKAIQNYFIGKDPQALIEVEILAKEMINLYRMRK